MLFCQFEIIESSIMKTKLRLFIVLALLLSFCLAYAQQTTEITGKVVDENGESLPGVSVMVKGLKIGTVTNVDGFYAIKINSPKSAALIYSFIGMDPKEEKVGGRKIVNVKLTTSSVQLNEVVAIGYSNMKRKDLTGSVVSVDAAAMAKVPTSDVAQALAGRVSGVQVSQSEGSPGASISIRVRGGISITGNNEPLYIIDGFPTESGLSSIDRSPVPL